MDSSSIPSITIDDLFDDDDPVIHPPPAVPPEPMEETESLPSSNNSVLDTLSFKKIYPGTFDSLTYDMTHGNIFSSIPTSSDLEELRHRMLMNVDFRPQRSRKPNYSDTEKRIFFSLISPYVRFLDAKSQEKSYVSLKGDLWRKITNKYNEYIKLFPGSNFVPRDLVELRTFWKNIRRADRKRKLDLISKTPTVPDLGDRIGVEGSGKYDGASTSYACSPSLGADDPGDSGTSQDHLLSDPADQEDCEDKKTEVFAEETLDEEVNNCNSENSSSDQANSAAFPGMSGFYLLKKDTHCTTILDQLLHDETYADVTLTAQGGSLKAHRIVLSLASGYFREVLSRDSTVKNVIVFKDLKFAELKNVINFIYTGEATVDASELESFMSVAEMLEIASLCDGHRSLPKQFISQRRDSPDVTLPTPVPSASASKSSKRSSTSVASSSSTGPVSPPAKSRKTASSQDSSSHHKQASSTASNNAGQETIPVIKTEPEAYDGLLDEFDDPLAITSKGSKEKRPPDDYSIDDHIPGRCPYCPSSEPIHMGEEMTVHLQMNHSSKPFINCHVCSRVFTLKSVYKKHQEICKSA